MKKGEWWEEKGEGGNGAAAGINSGGAGAIKERKRGGVAGLHT